MAFSSKSLICSALMAAALLQCAYAASHTVGGTTGWTIPASASLYPNWASSQSFKVEDTLVFNFQTSVHDVIEVSKSEYDACTSVSPIATYTTGPATVTLNRTGTYYFLCSVGQHCANGQKITINVLAATSPAASPVSSPPATSPTVSPTTPKQSPAAAPTTPKQSPAAAPTTPSPVSSTPPTTVVSSPPPSSPNAEAPATPGTTADTPVGNPPSSAPSVGVFGVVTLLAVMIPLVLSF